MQVDDLVEVATKVSQSLDGEDVPREVVLMMLNGQLPSVISDDMVAYKIAQGWKEGGPGDEYDEDKKIDPNLKVWGRQGPDVTSRADAVFAVVSALKHFITSGTNDPVVPPSLQNMTSHQREEWEKLNHVDLSNLVIENEVLVAQGARDEYDKPEKEDTVLAPGENVGVKPAENLAVTEPGEDFKFTPGSVPGTEHKGEAERPDIVHPDHKDEKDHPNISGVSDPKVPEDKTITSVKNSLPPRS